MLKAVCFSWDTKLIVFATCLFCSLKHTGMFKTHQCAIDESAMAIVHHAVFLLGRRRRGWGLSGVIPFCLRRRRPLGPIYCLSPPVPMSRHQTDCTAVPSTLLLSGLPSAGRLAPRLPVVKTPQQGGVPSTCTKDEPAPVELSRDDLVRLRCLLFVAFAFCFSSRTDRTDRLTVRTVDMNASEEFWPWSCFVFCTFL